MKRTIALMLLALPLGLSALAKSAAADEFNATPNATRYPIAISQRDRFDRNRDRQPPRRQELRRPEVRRVLVPGYWQRTARGRVWVPAHYETRR
jgi:hypothetical protein